MITVGWGGGTTILCVGGCVLPGDISGRATEVCTLLSFQLLKYLGRIPYLWTFYSVRFPVPSTRKYSTRLIKRRDCLRIPDKRSHFFLLAGLAYTADDSNFSLPTRCNSIFSCDVVHWHTNRGSVWRCFSLLSSSQHAGDMIELYKIFAGKYDGEITEWITGKCIERHDTRNHRFALQQSHSHIHYDIRKFSFSNRIIPLWNSLPDNIVSSPTLNTFKAPLKFWENQDVQYD